MPERSRPTGFAARAALLALAAALPGAAMVGAASAAECAGTRAAALDATRFDADLHACKATQGGRMAQRHARSAFHPRIAACLQRRGWAADGTPLLQRLVAPG